MQEIQKMAQAAVISDSTGTPILTVGHLLAGAVGFLGLYLFIPERQRKNIFK